MAWATKLSNTPRCVRPGCGHPRFGKAGHFNDGKGPCRVQKCDCSAYAGRPADAPPRSH